MDKQNPPRTIGEVGIHIAYMHEKMDQMSSLLQQSIQTYVTKEEFKPIEETVKTLSDERQQNIGKGISRKELWTSVGAVALLMSAVWWLPGLTRLLVGK